MAEAIAHELAKKQKEISVAEFFERNKHILGFGNPTRALVTSVKEGVDNSLDACEESGILPDIYVEIRNHEDGENKLIIEDNATGYEIEYETPGPTSVETNILKGKRIVNRWLEENPWGRLFEEYEE